MFGRPIRLGTLGGFPDRGILIGEPFPSTNLNRMDFNFLPLTVGLPVGSTIGSRSR
jgi:hypothetical protein